MYIYIYIAIPEGLTAEFNAETFLIRLVLGDTVC